MNEIILVVDDDSTNLMIAQKILGKEFRMAAANSGMASLKYLEKNKPALILLDLNMPDMDGFETYEKIKQMEHVRTVPVIFLTAETSAETETMCFQAGAVDFVGKPFVADVLLSRVRRTLELEKYRNHLEEVVKEQAAQIEEKTRRITEMQEQTIIGMANLIECRDGSTGTHVKNTQKYIHLLAAELLKKGLFTDILNEDYIISICKAAPLHDIGKIKIPDGILQKPAKLTDHEYTAMKMHTEYSGNIIKDILGSLSDVRHVEIAKDIAMYHHERWDGMGYPRGLKGDEIPLCARIMAVVDVFDALCSERCYKPPLRPIEKVLEILENGKGTQFDPTIIDVFLPLKPILEQMIEEE